MLQRYMEGNIKRKSKKTDSKYFWGLGNRKRETEDRGSAIFCNELQRTIYLFKLCKYRTCYKTKNLSNKCVHLVS